MPACTGREKRRGESVLLRERGAASLTGFSLEGRVTQEKPLKQESNNNKREEEKLTEGANGLGPGVRSARNTSDKRRHQLRRAVGRGLRRNRGPTQGERAQTFLQHG